MAKAAEDIARRRWNPWRIVGWSILPLLLLPLLAAQSTNEVGWSVGDFILAAGVLGGLGLAFELIVLKSRSLSYRLGAALAVFAAILTILVNGAVGMIGSEDNGYNIVFLGIVVLALVGVILARSRAAGMRRAMIVTAAAQAVAGAVGLSVDMRGAVLSISFAGLWLLAAALFRNAARDQDRIRAAA